MPDRLSARLWTSEGADYAFAKRESAVVPVRTLKIRAQCMPNQ